tara:strand:- start:576 stop:758 length:183 start_codon:yes stop_codon:yes gene_type:complete
MVISTNPPPINGISRKPGEVFDSGFAANAIAVSQGSGSFVLGSTTAGWEAEASGSKESWS